MSASRAETTAETQPVRGTASAVVISSGSSPWPLLPKADERPAQGWVPGAGSPGLHRSLAQKGSQERTKAGEARTGVCTQPSSM